VQELHPDNQSVIKALEEVLASAYFSRSARQTDFLRFVVESWINSPERTLSSVDISTDCFGRTLSNDPNDAYVRNIASQTRRSLKNFYSGLAQPAELIIQLADKGYKPKFVDPSAQKTESVTPLVNEIPAPQPIASNTANKLLPTIAIIPFQCLAGDELQGVMGELMSDSLITSLAKSKYMRVISRRTSTQFGGQESLHTTHELGKQLNADYVVEGRYYVHGDSVRLQIELCSCESDEVIWADQLRTSIEALVAETDDLIDQMLFGITSQLLNHELQRALTTPLSSLQCHSLLIGSINIMHRGTPSDFDRAKQMLELLAERNPLHATPSAHLAYWGLLNIVRDSSNNETSLSKDFVLDHAAKALGRDSLHPIALTASGMVKSHFDSDFQGARVYLEQALLVSPNEAAAMGRMAISQLYTDTPTAAFKMATDAIKTSPFDPELYFFHTGAAFASFGAGNYSIAIEHAERSRQLFPKHPSNLRILVGSYTALKDWNNVEISKQALLDSMPSFSVQDYLKKTPSPQHQIIQTLSSYLEKSGLPVRLQKQHSS